MPIDPASLSKLMSFILRHSPESFGLTADSAGWVDLDSFIAGVRTQRGYEAVGLEDLEAAISSSNKVRHEVAAGRIRALYGHSMATLIEYEAVNPPTQLFHGTISQALPEIAAEGLRPMSRQYVHLSSDPKTAVAVGMRHGENPVLLRIRAAAAAECGTKFYNPWDIIWLSCSIPSQFVELA